MHHGEFRRPIHRNMQSDGEDGVHRLSGRRSTRKVHRHDGISKRDLFCEALPCRKNADHITRPAIRNRRIQDNSHQEAEPSSRIPNPVYRTSYLVPSKMTGRAYGALSDPGICTRHGNGLWAIGNWNRPFSSHSPSSIAYGLVPRIPNLRGFWPSGLHVANEGTRLRRFSGLWSVYAAWQWSGDTGFGKRALSSHGR